MQNDNVIYTVFCTLCHKGGVDRVKKTSISTCRTRSWNVLENTPQSPGKPRDVLYERWTAPEFDDVQWCWRARSGARNHAVFFSAGLHAYARTVWSVTNKFGLVTGMGRDVGLGLDPCCILMGGTTALPFWGRGIPTYTDCLALCATARLSIRARWPDQWHRN